jgi:ABC-type dipeptide/oligopeptide/nickel transport system permease component
VLTYIGQRLLGLVLVLAVALVLTFVANRFVPGDPVLMMLGDQSGNQALAASLRQQYGLDRPLVEQFASYLSGIARGDLGLSFRHPGTPVTAIIRDGLKISPVLASGALLIAAPLGLALGILAALMFVLVAGLSIPNFALAAFFVWLFSLKLGLLPVAGWREPAHAVLPILVLAIAPAAYIARLARTFMLEVLQQDYMRTARAKGLVERVVIWRHGLRNVLVPILTVMGVILGGLITGTFVVETLFNIPGLGRIAIESIFARDYPVTMAIVLLFTLTYATINFLVDVLYAVIDPRIRVEGRP